MTSYHIISHHIISYHMISHYDQVTTNKIQDDNSTHLIRRQRPYRVECTGSLPNSEVKRRRARLVLGWGTAREDLRVLSAFSISVIFLHDRITLRAFWHMHNQQMPTRKCIRSSEHFRKCATTLPHRYRMHAVA